MIPMLRIQFRYLRIEISFCLHPQEAQVAGDIADQTPLVNTLFLRSRRPRKTDSGHRTVIRENEEFLRYGLVIGSSGPVK